LSADFFAQLLQAGVDPKTWRQDPVAVEPEVTALGG
jgi:hypothetical protein